MSVYVNGQLASQQTAPSSIIGDNLSDLIIGKASWVYSNTKGLSGTIDDIGLWNRALSATEVQNLYNASAPTSCIANIINNDTTICAGQSVTLNANNYRIGETGPGGGLIFYDKGNNNGGWRYMEVTKTDQASSSGMGCYCTAINPVSDSVGFGLSNTLSWSVQGCSGWASQSLNYSFNGFSDWFIPSKNELNLIYQNLRLNNIGNFQSSGYWSSSPAGYGSCGINGGAWVQSFIDGSQYSDSRNGYQGAI